MNQQIWRPCVAVSLCLTFLAAYAAPAGAAPNGKTYTYEIVTGAAAVFNGIKLLADNAKANQSGRDAEHFMHWKARTAPTVASAHVPALDNLQTLRAIIISHVKGALRNGPWRQRYESLRTCWNQYIFAKSTGAKTAGPQSASAATPAPGTPPVADCTTGVQWPSAPIQDDELDTKDAFANAPTLYQQILAANLATYVPQNEARADIIYLQSYSFLLNYFPESVPTQPKATDVFSVSKSCIGGTDIAGCLTALQGAETGAATAHRAKVACSFARGAWLPTVTLIMRESAVTAATDFGQVPGC